MTDNNDDLQKDVEGMIPDADGAVGDAADSAKDMLGDAKDKLPGNPLSGKGAAAAAGAAGVVGGLKGKASDLLGGGDTPDVDVPDAGAAAGAGASLKERAAAAKANMADAAGSMKDKAAGAAGSAKDAAAGATAGVAGAAATASDKVSAAGSAASGAVADAAPATVSGGVTRTGGGNSGGGSGSGGSSGGSGSGGSGGGSDDDDEGFFAGTPISGEWQIIGLGLLVAALFLFGTTILGWFGGSDAVEFGDEVAIADIDPLCDEVFDELKASDLDADDYNGLTCEVQDGEAIVAGEVDSDATRLAVAGVIAGASVEAADRLTVPEAEEVEEVAAEAPTTTTTAAPETTTTTTAAPETTTTTTAAPETTTTTEAAAPELTTMWDAMNGSGQAGQFAAIGGALGLQDSLEASAEDSGGQRTLFAPSDEALGKLDASVLQGLVADQGAANALVGYHFLPGALSAEDIVALDGQTVDSLTGLPLSIAVVDGQVVINGEATVVGTDFTADNGIVHIIDTVLTPPALDLGIENVEFEVNSDVITAAGQEELQKAVNFFTESANTAALIEGHTDTDGNDADNLDLSQRRAESVKAFLVDNGLDGDRFTTQGFGESRPILVDGVEDKPASRRIEFQVR